MYRYGNYAHCENKNRICPTIRNLNTSLTSFSGEVNRSDEQLWLGWRRNRLCSSLIHGVVWQDLDAMSLAHILQLST